MSTIAETARAFFDACETGKGWEGCSPYCHPDATFAAQSEPIAEMKTLREYTEWMKGIMTVLPDATYVVKAFATDNERQSVSGFGVFSLSYVTGPAGAVNLNWSPVPEPASILGACTVAAGAAGCFR